MTQDNSNGNPGQDSGCDCASPPVIDTASDLRSHVRDVSDFSGSAFHSDVSDVNLERNQSDLTDPTFLTRTAEEPRRDTGDGDGDTDGDGDGDGAPPRANGAECFLESGSDLSNSPDRYEQMEHFVRAAIHDPKKMWVLTRNLASHMSMTHCDKFSKGPANPSKKKYNGGATAFERGYGSADEMTDCKDVPRCETYFIGDHQITGTGQIPYVTHYMCPEYGFGKTGDLNGSVDHDVEYVIVICHGTFDEIVSPSPTKAFLNTSPAHNIYYQMHKGIQSMHWPNAPQAPHVAVIAPLFQRADYMPFTDAVPTVPYWRVSNNWVNGDLSRYIPAEMLTPAVVPPKNASSYDYLDIILKKAAQKYPSANFITLAGHSAGGQMVERYAMLENGMRDRLTTNYGIDLKYVVLNADHCWLTPFRPIWGSLNDNPNLNGEPNAVDPGTRHWGIPISCQDTDIWSYGFSSGVEDNGRRSQALQRLREMPWYTNQYTDRDAVARSYMTNILIHHFQDIEDSVIAGNQAGYGYTGCRPFQFGKSRLERFRNFRESFMYNSSYNPGFQEHRFTEVFTGSGKAHDQSAMLQNYYVLKKMFHSNW